MERVRSDYSQFYISESGKPVELSSGRSQQSSNRLLVVVSCHAQEEHRQQYVGSILRRSRKESARAAGAASQPGGFHILGKLASCCRIVCSSSSSSAFLALVNFQGRWSHRRSLACTHTHIIGATVSGKSVQFGCHATRTASISTAQDQQH